MPLSSGRGAFTPLARLRERVWGRGQNQHLQGIFIYGT